MSSIEPVTAAGGVVYSEREDGSFDVVLIYRRGVWDLPKGKLEENESVRECAAREVAEEIGLAELPEITGQLSDTYHEYKESDTRYGKTTHWFAMILNSDTGSGFDPQQEEDIEKVEWKQLTDAKQLVGYDNLREVLNSFEELIHPNRS